MDGKSIPKKALTNRRAIRESKDLLHPLRHEMVEGQSPHSTTVPRRQSVGADKRLRDRHIGIRDQSILAQKMRALQGDDKTSATIQLALKDLETEHAINYFKKGTSINSEFHRNKFKNLLTKELKKEPPSSRSKMIRALQRNKISFPELETLSKKTDIEVSLQKLSSKDSFQVEEAKRYFFRNSALAGSTFESLLTEVLGEKINTPELEQTVTALKKHGLSATGEALSLNTIKFMLKDVSNNQADSKEILQKYLASKGETLSQKLLTTILSDGSADETLKNIILLQKSNIKTTPYLAGIEGNQLKKGNKIGVAVSLLIRANLGDLEAQKKAKEFILSINDQALKDTLIAIRENIKNNNSWFKKSSASRTAISDKLLGFLEKPQVKTNMVLPSVKASILSSFIDPNTYQSLSREFKEQLDKKITDALIASPNSSNINSDKILSDLLEDAYNQPNKKDFRLISQYLQKNNKQIMASFIIKSLKFSRLTGDLHKSTLSLLFSYIKPHHSTQEEEVAIKTLSELLSRNENDYAKAIYEYMQNDLNEDEFLKLIETFSKLSPEEQLAEFIVKTKQVIEEFQWTAHKEETAIVKSLSSLYKFNTGDEPNRVLSKELVNGIKDPIVKSALVEIRENIKKRIPKWGFSDKSMPSEKESAANIRKLIELVRRNDREGITAFQKLLSDRANYRAMPADKPMSDFIKINTKDNTFSVDREGQLEYLKTHFNLRKNTKEYKKQLKEYILGAALGDYNALPEESKFLEDIITKEIANIESAEDINSEKMFLSLMSKLHDRDISSFRKIAGCLKRNDAKALARMALKGLTDSNPEGPDDFVFTLLAYYSTNIKLQNPTHIAIEENEVGSFFKSILDNQSFLDIAMSSAEISGKKEKGSIISAQEMLNAFVGETKIPLAEEYMRLATIRQDDPEELKAVYENHKQKSEYLWGSEEDFLKNVKPFSEYKTQPEYQSKFSQYILRGATNTYADISQLHKDKFITLTNTALENADKFKNIDTDSILIEFMGYLKATDPEAHESMKMSLDLRIHDLKTEKLESHILSGSPKAFDSIKDEDKKLFKNLIRTALKQSESIQDVDINQILSDFLSHLETSDPIAHQAVTANLEPLLSGINNPAAYTKLINSLLPLE